VLAFLDAYPQAPGHTLIIPKHGRARNFLELDDRAIPPLFSCAKRLMTVIVTELERVGVQMPQFNGGDGGQSVFHFHIHLVPRWKGLAAGPPCPDTRRCRRTGETC